MRTRTYRLQHVALVQDEIVLLWEADRAVAAALGGCAKVAEAHVVSLCGVEELGVHLDVEVAAVEGPPEDFVCDPHAYDCSPFEDAVREHVVAPVQRDVRVKRGESKRDSARRVGR